MDFSKISVLLVDDLYTMRLILGGLLRDTGFEHLAEAQDGAEALYKLEHGSYQFIVSDWHMPAMNGLELLKAVRNSACLKHLPFRTMSAVQRCGMDAASSLRQPVLCLRCAGW